MLTMQLRAWVLGGLAAAAGSALAEPVEVSFVDAARYADAGNTLYEEQANLKTLAAHLQSLGSRYLAPETQLKIEVLGVDLAGEPRPTRLGTELRIARGGADWPRITLRYTLQGKGGDVLSQGQETIADLNYLRHIADMRSTDPLRHEKRMLDRWFRERFAQTVARAGG